MSRDGAFISGSIAQRVPFILTERGANADPFGLLTILYKKQFALIEQPHCRVR